MTDLCWASAEAPAAASRQTLGGVRVTTVLLALAATGTFLFSLSRSILDPLTTDQMIFHYITRQVSQGAVLYRDLWTQNTPAIVGIHALGMKLFGTGQISLRLLDAFWQLFTMLAIVLLAAREGRWSLGWLAAMLYTLTYYGCGPAATAQREGFAVLPMLLMVHAVMTQADDLPAAWSDRTRTIALGAVYLLSGAMGFAVAFLKPPLGMCYGAVWLVVVGQVGLTWWRGRGHRDELIRLAGLTFGFLLAAGLAWAWLVRLGWWQAYREVSALQGFSDGFMLGPWMIRQEMPAIILGGVALLFLFAAILPVRQFPHAVLSGGIVLTMLVLLQAWPLVGSTLLRTAGVVLPAFGAVLLAPWEGRSRAWRWMLLMGVCGIAAVLLQGRWAAYRYMPAYVAAAFLTAGAIMSAMETQSASRVWLAVCLAAVVHLAVSHWGRTMLVCGVQPYLLAQRSLDEHYCLAAKGSHGVRQPTLLKVAARVQSMTRPDEPIANLFMEPALYYACDRPPVHRLISPAEVYHSLFPEFVAAILDRKPKVLLARVPEGTGGGTPEAVSKAVFSAVQTDLGRSAAAIADHYHVVDVIDQVAILGLKAVGAS